MAIHIIALAGPKGAGKTHITDQIQQRLWAIGIKTAVMESFANPLKRALSSMTGIPEEYFFTPALKEVKVDGYDCSARDLMVTIGQQVKELAGQSVFAKATDEKFKTFEGITFDRKDVYILIDDLRFEAELDVIRKYSHTVVFVNPVEYDPFTEISERGLIHRKTDDDYIVHNDKEYPQKAIDLAEWIVSTALVRNS